jgi:SAM-dependent methyltransferase
MSVLDVPCGVGLLDAEAGPFKRYVGVDFSDRAIKEAGRRVRSRKVELVCGDAIASVRLMKDQMGSFDVVICCGLLCFPAMFQDVASAAEYVQRLSELVVDDGAVIANMPWSGHKYEDDIAVYSIDEAIRCLDDKGLHVEVRFGYLPHEFIVVCRKKENER